MQADRAAAAAALAAAQERHAALSAECAKHAASDPETLKRLADMKKVALDAANRWTDNRAPPLCAAFNVRARTDNNLRALDLAQCMRSRTGR